MTCRWSVRQVPEREVIYLFGSLELCLASMSFPTLVNCHSVFEHRGLGQYIYARKSLWFIPTPPLLDRHHHTRVPQQPHFRRILVSVILIRPSWVSLKPCSVCGLAGGYRDGSRIQGEMRHSANSKKKRHAAYMLIRTRRSCIHRCVIVSFGIFAGTRVGYPLPMACMATRTCFCA